MDEPLHEPYTDDEFEKIKTTDGYCEILAKTRWPDVVQRLIATVDYWRRERQQTAKDSVSVIDRLQEENAGLRNKLWFGPDRTELEEENVRLKTEFKEIYDYAKDLENKYVKPHPESGK